MIMVGGCDYKDFLKKHEKNGTVLELIISPGYWDFYHQYEGALQDLSKSIKFAQNTALNCDNELYEVMQAM